MSVFDLFRSKKSPIKELKKIKQEIANSSVELEESSKELKKQIESLMAFQKDEVAEKIEGIHLALKSNLEKVIEAKSLMTDLREKKINSLEFNEKFKTAEIYLGVWNATFELDMKDYNSHAKTFNMFCANTVTKMEQVESFIETFPIFLQKLDSLNTKIESFISRAERENHYNNI